MEASSGSFESEEQLDERLSRPGELLVRDIRRLTSPLVIVGAGGKMGPSLAVMAQRAAQAAGHPLDVIAVSRFSDSSARNFLERQGVATVVCDLLDPAAVRRLPDAPNVLYLAGLKFGTQTNPSLTWAVNTLGPSHVASRYHTARIVALSTGNVYPLVPVGQDGAREEHALTPIGEYANAAVARERLFEYFSRRHETPMILVRLSYAVELRYGVLVDIAQKVWAGTPVHLAMGYLNCIWQGDANEAILRAFALAETPPERLNLTGPEPLAVRDLAARFGNLLDRPVQFAGSESATALLSSTERLKTRLGQPATPLADVMRWVADWIRNGGRTLGMATHFEVRDGAY